MPFIANKGADMSDPTAVEIGVARLKIATTRAR